MSHSSFQSQMIISEAWRVKCEEVYKEAEKKYPYDKSLQQFRKIYDAKKQEIIDAQKNAQKDKSTLRAGCAVFGFGCGAFIYVVVFLLLWQLCFFSWAWSM